MKPENTPDRERIRLALERVRQAPKDRRYATSSKKKPPITAEQSANMRDLVDELKILADERDSLYSIVGEKDILLEKISSQRQDREASLEAIKSRIDSLRIESDKLQALMDEMTVDFEKTKSQRETIFERLKETKDEITKLRKKHLSEKERRQRSQERLYGAEEVSESIPKKIKELDMSIARMNSEIEDLLREIKGLDRERSNAKKSLQESIEKIKSLECEINCRNMLLDAHRKAHEMIIKQENLSEEKDKIKSKALKIQEDIKKAAESFEKNKKKHSQIRAVLDETEPLKTPDISDRYRTYARLPETPKELMEVGEEYTQKTQESRCVEEELNHLKKQIAHTRESLAKYSEKQEYTEGKIASIEGSARELTRELTDAISAAGLEAGVVSLNVPAELEESLKEIRDRIRLEKTTLDSLTGRERHLLSRFDELQSASAGIKKEWEEKEARARSRLKGEDLSVEAEIIRLEGVIRELEKKRRENVERLKGISRELAVTEEILVKDFAQKHALMRLIYPLKKYLDKATNRKTAIAAEMDRINSALSEKKLELEQIKATASHEEDRISSAEKKYITAHARIHEITQMKNKDITEIEDIRGEAIKLGDEIPFIAQDIEDSKAKSQDIVNSIEKLTKELKILDVDLDALNERMISCEKTISAYRGKNTLLVSKAANLEVEASKIKKSIEKEREKENTCMKEKKEIQEKIAKCSQKISIIEAEIKIIERIYAS
jgi:chromosome segregation protein